jgi:hypothetical protein
VPVLSAAGLEGWGSKTQWRLSGTWHVALSDKNLCLCLICALLAAGVLACWRLLCAGLVVAIIACCLLLVESYLLLLLLRAAGGGRSVGVGAAGVGCLACAT